MTKPKALLIIVLSGCGCNGGGEAQNEELPYLAGQVRT